MIEVTRILDAIEQGDPSAAKQLLPLVYDELRRLAARKAAGNFLEKLWCAAARIAIGFRTENKRKKGSMPFWSAALFRR
ncbi:MAG: ECF-type sigma factor, partial [Gemmataceae bacterium]